MHLPGKDSSTLIPDPTWPCGMPDGIPSPERGVGVCSVELPLAQVYEVGDTPYGRRTVVVTKGGVISGSKLDGTALPGGLDFQVELSNGVVEIEQVLVLQMSDGTVIYMRNAGVGITEMDVRVVMDIEAPNGSPYAWLNTGRYVARRDVDFDSMTMKLAVYDVSGVRADHAVRIVKPTSRPPQPWGYRSADPLERPGDRIIRERVTLGGWMTLGESKRGVRNIIPITGGELTGRIKGKVLFGGGDYQLQSDVFTLDARYLWQTDEGEIIIVRNAGTFGSLVPAFEARIDGAYAWLNTGKYLSSDPAVDDGTVSLVMYQSRSSQPASR